MRQGVKALPYFILGGNMKREDRKGLSPNNKIFNADEAYRDGLISMEERDEAILKKTPYKVTKLRLKKYNNENRL